MKIRVKYNDRLYSVEQDRRGQGEEAEVIIHYHSTEIFRKAYKKFTNSYDLRDYAVARLAEMNL